MNIDGKPDNIKFNSLLSRIQMFEKNASSNNSNNEKRKEPMKIKRDFPKNEEIIVQKNDDLQKKELKTEEVKEENLKIDLSKKEESKKEENLKIDLSKKEDNLKIDSSKKEELKKEENLKIENENIKQEESKPEIPKKTEISKLQKSKTFLIPFSSSTEPSQQELNNPSLTTTSNTTSTIKNSLESMENQIFRHSNTIITQPRPNINIPPNQNETTLNGEIFLNPIEIPEEVKNESFCEGFFIASFPKENGKVENDSEEYKSDCGHKECSSLPAMQPEIIYRYPEKDTKELEINNLAASICFPFGIKICYDEVNNPSVVKNYYSSITNQTGDRFYILTYHFYIKMMNGNFVQQYQIHPIKYLTMKFCNDYYETIETDSSLQEKIQLKLEEFSELNFREIVNIPFCFCLISKHPFFNQMEKCLESIKSEISNYSYNGNDLHKLIKYIVKEIPFPKQHSKIEFPLPYIPEINELANPYLEDLTLVGPNPSILFNFFSVDNIILIFRLMLFEQKILFVDSEFQRLGEITNAFVSLLYPFQWIHTFIPIMSVQMLKYLQAFLPFINGIHSDLWKKAEEELKDAEEGVYIVNINSNTIDINWAPTSKKIKIVKKINENIPLLPKHIEKELYNQLSNLKTLYEKAKKDKKYKKNFNVCIYNLIMQIFSEMLYDYKTYLTVIDDYPIFNTNSLINSRPKADEKFFKEFTETQIFQLFIQNAVKKNSNIYFNERIKLYLELKDKDKYIKEKTTNEFYTSCSKSREIEKICIIKPYFLKANESYSSLEEYKKILQDTYPINNQICNKKGITKEDKRIIGQDLKLDYVDKNKTYNYYHIPNTPINVSNDQITSKITARVSMYEKREKLLNNKSSCVRMNGKKAEWNLTDNEKDDIKDNIKDILARVLKCEEINESEDKKQLINCIENSFGRNYFIDILYQKNISERSEKAINKPSFDLLTIVIHNAILSILKLDENKENLTSAVLLIKSAELYYYINEKSKNVFLIDALYQKFKGLNLFTKVSFWEQWINISLKDETNYKKSDSSSELIIGKILKNIIMIMLNSKIAKDSTYDIFLKLLANRVKKPENIISFKNDFAEIFKKFK